MFGALHNTTTVWPVEDLGRALEPLLAGITIEVMAHPLQKDGQFYLVPDSQVKRIGSTDLTFAIPGRGGSGEEEYWYPLQGSSVMQRQCRADWQVVVLKPPAATVGDGVTYS